MPGVYSEAKLADAEQEWAEQRTKQIEVTREMLADLRSEIRPGRPRVTARPYHDPLGRLLDRFLKVAF